MKAFGAAQLGSEPSVLANVVAESHIVWAILKVNGNMGNHMDTLKTLLENTSKN
jgi:hypothetical protein